MRVVRSLVLLGVATVLIFGSMGCNTQTEIPLAKVPPPPPGFGEAAKAAPGTKAGSPTNAAELVK